MVIENELRQVKRRYTELRDRYDVRVCPAAACVCLHVYVCMCATSLLLVANYNH